MAISKLLCTTLFLFCEKRQGHSYGHSNDSREMQLGFLRSAGEGRQNNVSAFKTMLTAAIPTACEKALQGP